jgi:hypothetical protein
MEKEERVVTKSITIRKCVGTLMMAVLASGTILAQGSGPAAQTPPPQPATKVEKPIIPLKVQVTLSRYDGEKKLSSLPFTLWVNANDSSTTSLNVGVQVPLSEAPTPQNLQGISYRSVGTSMTCSATLLDDGRFRLNLIINDSSVSPAKEKGGLVSFQSLQTTNYLLLRDGQTAQFLAATDKVTGEVTRVEVIASVLK